MISFVVPSGFFTEFIPLKRKKSPFKDALTAIIRGAPGQDVNSIHFCSSVLLAKSNAKK